MIDIDVQCILFCSSQSRADLLTLGLAVTNILTGLVWLSVRPKSITAVSSFHLNFQLLPLSIPLFSWIKLNSCIVLVFVQVNPQGVECKRVCTGLPDVAVTELLW